MIIALLIAALSLSPRTPVIDVDVAEINHYHDAKGEHVFDQMVYWKWMKLATGPNHHVNDWRLIRGKAEPIIWQVEGRKRIIFTDDESVIRIVMARTVRETWTTRDPELEDRKYLPKDDRPLYFHPLPAVAD